MKLFVSPSMSRHPKVYRLASALGVNAREARGLLLCLWLWTMEYRESGTLSDVSFPELAAAADWQGEPKLLIDALVDVRLLDRTHDGFAVHDWDEHQGSLPQKREREKLKKRRQRANRKAKSARNSVPSAVPAMSPKSEGASTMKMSPGDTMGTVPLNREGTSPPSEWLGKDGKGVEGTGKDGEGTAPPTTGENGAVEHLVRAAHTAGHISPISAVKARKHIEDALALGAKAGAIEEAVMNPAHKGWKLWDVLEPLKPQKPKPSNGEAVVPLEELLRKRAERDGLKRVEEIGEHFVAGPRRLQ